MPQGKRGFQKGHKQFNTGKTHFKKGQVGYWKGKHPPTEFQKGCHIGLGIAKSKKHKENIGKAKRGDKNPSWRGGITPKNIEIRNSLEYKLWRKSCLIRDNFTDQKTGISGGYLMVHHINNFADFPELRFAIDNGITFSKETHKEFHEKYGCKNNTKGQLEEFLNQ